MKKKLHTFCVCLLILSASTQTLSAQWASHGPYGGAITALATDGPNIYAGTMANGIFKSNDMGVSWTAANAGLTGTWVNDLTVNSDGIFAATYQGIYYSSNSGTTWMQRNNGLIDVSSERIFAAGNTIYISTSEGVFVSNDKGATWQSKNNGLPPYYTIYAYGQMGDTVYAGTYGKGLFRTADKGNTWTPVAGGFPVPLSEPGNTYVYSIASGGNEIFVSTNKGIYVSTDRGISWNHSTNSYMTENPPQVLAVNGSSLWAGTYGTGLHVSNDNAASFVDSNNGLQWFPGYPSYVRASDILGLGNSVLAATYFGLYRTINNGLNWNNSNEGILATDVMAVASNSTAAFAAADWTGVYMTSNKGMSWTRVNNGLQGNSMRTICSAGEDIFVSVLNKRVYRFDANGPSWSFAGTGLPGDAVLLEGSSQRVVAVTAAGKYNPEKLYQTKDKGLSWQQIPYTLMGGGISALAVREPNIYYGTGMGILLRSSNDGNSWNDKSFYLPQVKITAILPLDTVTYIGTEGKGIFMLLKNESYLQTASSGLAHYNITDIVKQNDILFASTNGGGVYVSANGGSNWFPYNEGLDNKSVRNLSGQDLKVFASTSAGVYQTLDASFNDITVLAGVTSQKADIDISFYPNPSKGIVYFNSPSSNVEIVVFDIRGKQVAASSHTGFNSQVDLSTQLPGVYLLKITTDSGSAVKRIIIN